MNHIEDVQNSIVLILVASHLQDSSKRLIHFTSLDFLPRYLIGSYRGTLYYIFVGLHLSILTCLYKMNNCLLIMIGIIVFNKVKLNIPF